MCYEGQLKCDTIKSTVLNLQFLLIYTARCHTAAIRVKYLLKAIIAASWDMTQQPSDYKSIYYVLSWPIMSFSKFAVMDWASKLCITGTETVKDLDTWPRRADFRSMQKTIGPISKWFNSL